MRQAPASQLPAQEPRRPPGSSPGGTSASLTAEAFRQALDREFATATATGTSHIKIRAGDLHHTVGGYPGRDHRMPTCCSVMKRVMLPGDMIFETPLKGAGANLTVEYKLPRDLSSR
jgi:hypothetical protein